MLNVEPQDVCESKHPLKIRKKIGLIQFLIAILFLYLIKELVFVKILLSLGLHAFYAKKFAFITFYLTFFALSYHVYSNNDDSPKSLIINGCSEIRPNVIRLIIGIALCLTFLELSFLALQYFSSVYVDENSWNFSIKDNIFYPNLKLGSLSNGYLSVPTALFILTQMILGPIYEEILFRGFIQRNLTKRIGGISAIIISSICFAMLHDQKQMLAVFISGLIYGLVFLRTENLWYSIVLHSLINLFIWLSEGFGLLIYFTSKEPEQLFNIGVWKVEIILFVIFVPMLFYLLKKINNYKQTSF